MTGPEFEAAAKALVGSGRGWQTRVANTCGLNKGTIGSIMAGVRPVPARYAVAVEAALVEADRVGRFVAFFSPRLENALREARSIGCERDAGLAAIAAWAALRLAGSRP